MNEQGYIELLKNIIINGKIKKDRTGTGTLSIFAPNSLRFNLEQNTFPLLTTKRVPWKAVIKELLWFTRGDTDAHVLQAQGVNIWNGNTTREFLDSRGLVHLPEGSIGEGYGFQWRHFGAKYDSKYGDTSKMTNDEKNDIGGFDQLAYIEDLIANDPTSRRIFMSAWNPLGLSGMVLPCCHVSAQFYVDTETKHLSCHVYQRSADVFLGVPFNIASYATLVHILAARHGLEAKELILSFGDAHIYNSHMTQVEELLKRTSYEFPKIQLDKNLCSKDWSEMTIEDFNVKDYKCHSTIKAKMAI
jgi:thymidylate synthase